jgi:hypothetical protein
VPFPREGECEKNNNEFYESLINEFHYDLVIFSNHSAWDVVRQNFRLGASILDAHGIDYVLVGQLITYRDTPINLVARFARGNLAQVMYAEQDVSCSSGEHGLEQAVPPERFFSVRAALCDGDQPIFASGGHLLQADTLHLSDYGSVFVARKLVDWLRLTGHLP